MLDGDTIAVAGVGAVRYLGIDTPELHHPRKPVERFAARVAGRTVRLDTDVEERDAHGRLLAYVDAGDDMVNARLVAEGMAEQYPFAPSTLHKDHFARLERRAMRACRGQRGPAEGGPPRGCGQPGGLKLACDVMRHRPAIHVNVDSRGASADATSVPAALGSCVEVRERTTRVGAA